MQHGEAVITGAFEDEETKALYESLPDIRAMVPALLLGTTPEQQEADGEPGQATDDEPQLPQGEEAGPLSVALADVVNGGGPLLPMPESLVTSPVHASCTFVIQFAGMLVFNTRHWSAVGCFADGSSHEVASKAGKAEVDAVMACLPALSSREMCDEVSVNFAFVSSKGTRKRLVSYMPTPPELVADSERVPRTMGHHPWRYQEPGSSHTFCKPSKVTSEGEKMEAGTLAVSEKGWLSLITGQGAVPGAPRCPPSAAFL